MYDFIEGRLVALDPLSATVQTGGFGYLAAISLNTFTALQPFLGSERVCKLYLHHVVREDAQLFFGFATTDERALFRLLITVSGVGAGTARMILSSLSPAELQQVIAEGNVNALKNVKGIGLKTAQRILVDLKDKMSSVGVSDSAGFTVRQSSKEEALSALVNLGFAKPAVDKVLGKIIASKPNISVEELIKEALKAGI